MTKRLILMLVFVVVVIGGLLGFKYMNAVMTKKYLSSMGLPPQTVSTVKAALQDWQPQLQAVGTLRAVNGADLSPELPGIVEHIAFESGGDAEQGSVLVQLRAEDDVAKLHSLEATARLAEITYQRDVKQLHAQAVAQATVDNDLAALDSAKAQVTEQQAVVDKKTIRAPFAGHLGIRQVDVGQYLNAGTAIVTLQQLDPIYIDFNLPEQNLPHLGKGAKLTAHVDAFPDMAFEGEILAANSKVDEATRNIPVRAILKNPDHKLLPGMFGTVMIDTGAPQKFITLPQTAITFNPYGNTVFLVDHDKDNKPVAKQNFVTTGLTRGDQITVLTGVKDGDEVVSAGQIKLRNGVPLVINNEIQPKNDVNPKPEDR